MEISFQFLKESTGQNSEREDASSLGNPLLKELKSIFEMQTVRSVEKAKVLRLIYRWLAMFEQEPVARMIRLAFIIIYGQARRPSAKSAKLANLNGLLRRAVDGRRVIRRCCSMALSVDSKRVEELWFALKKVWSEN